MSHKRNSGEQRFWYGGHLDLARVVKGYHGVRVGSRFKSQYVKKMKYIFKKKLVWIKDLIKISFFEYIRQLLSLQHIRIVVHPEMRVHIAQILHKHG